MHGLLSTCLLLLFWNLKRSEKKMNEIETGMEKEPGLNIFVIDVNIFISIDMKHTLLAKEMCRAHKKCWGTICESIKNLNTVNKPKCSSCEWNCALKRSLGLRRAFWQITHHYAQIVRCDLNHWRIGIIPFIGTVPRNAYIQGIRTIFNTQAEHTSIEHYIYVYLSNARVHSHLTMRFDS